ncbi:ribosome maturation factor RimP [Phycicoccus sp. Soil748]|uniref:ribosome maturation factor RimP n=1 Tax=Intrasporangiaceae TaxID=85021 RepID=UPI000A675EBF|nr:ribosome maturation factor RimP [Phycicoccus sp. Soil748]
MSVKDQIRPAVEGPLAALGLLVEDVAVTPAGKRRLVRIWIDRVLEATDGPTTTATDPLSLDEVADATRTIGDALDEADAMGEQPYTLEVTSPGVDRPLTEPRHYRRNITRLVTLTPLEGAPVTGRLVSADDEGVTVEVPATKKTPARTEQHPYSALSRAAVEVEFSRPGAAPGPANDGDEHDDTDLHDDVDETDDDTEES